MSRPQDDLSRGSELFNFNILILQFLQNGQGKLYLSVEFFVRPKKHAGEVLNPFFNQNTCRKWNKSIEHPC